MHVAPEREEVTVPESADRLALRALPPFASLTSAHFERLCRDGRTRELPPRVRLVSEGSKADTLHVVLDGCVELYARANGREATIGIVRTGGLVDLSAIPGERVRLTSARTCAHSRLLTLPACAVREAIERDRKFARAVLETLADTHRVELRALKDIKLRSAVERLANRLLRYEREQGGRGSLVLPCDKRTLASLLTMTPENLSRAFAALSANGVAVKGRTIALADRAALVAFAHPDPLIDGRRRRSPRRADA